MAVFRLQGTWVLAALLLTLSPVVAAEPPPAPPPATPAASASPASPTPAAAPAKLRVALLPFEGEQAKRAYKDLIAGLKDVVDLAPEADAADAAKKNGTADPGQVAAVAEALKVPVVIFGAVRRVKSSSTLAVEIRDDTGGVIRVFEYPLPSGRPEKSTLKTMRKDVQTVVAAEATRLGQASVPEEPPPALENYRPPYVDAALGLLLTGRQFGFGKGSTSDGLATCQPGPTSCPKFSGAIAGGLRIDATFFPLRLVNSEAPILKHLIGLGVGITYDIVRWPDSIDEKSAPAACGGISPCRLATREQRLEVGLRYRWRIFDKEWSPLLLASLQYGLHSFSIDTPAGGVTVIPSVGYSYLDLGLGVLAPILGRASVALWVNGHPAFSAGAITSTAEYGPGRIGGVRGNLAAELLLWRTLSARVQGFYEVMWLSFSGSDMPMKITDGGARDTYWGATLGAGYTY